MGRVEKTIDGAASALLAGAAGYAVYIYLAMRGGETAIALKSVAASALALVVSYRALGAVRPRRRVLPVPIFDVREIDSIHDAPPADEPLSLDDILAELGPDSRVVRLFDPATMPSPTELGARIDRHLDPAPVDASEALHEALAELRRSLR
ncbi:MAG TPA: hypothetical protein VFK19_05770 [Sphingomicrobium sp.]|nr:hypothetical protein [Sphingomicrobium sp.]